jgi:hypothetical protein
MLLPHIWLSTIRFASYIGDHHGALAPAKRRNQRLHSQMNAELPATRAQSGFVVCEDIGYHPLKSQRESTRRRSMGEMLLTITNPFAASVQE